MSSKRAAKNSIIYVVSNFLHHGLAIILIPLYTNYLSPQEYGIIGVVIEFSLLASIFFTLSLESSILRFYFKKDKGPEYHKEFYGTINVTLISISIIVCLFFILTGKWTLRPFLNNINVNPYGYLGIAIVSLSPMYIVFKQILQAQQRGLIFSTVNLLKFVLELVLIIIVVALFRFGVVGVLGAKAIISLSFGVAVTLYLIKQYGFKIKRQYFRESMLYSLPLIPNKIAAKLNVSVNTFLLNLLTGTAAAGIFHMSTRLAIVVNAVIIGTYESYQPWCYIQFETGLEQNRRNIIRVTRLLLISFSVFALIVSLFAKEIFSLLTSNEYILAWKIFPFIAFTRVFHFIKNIWLVPLLYNKKGTKYVQFCTYTNLALLISSGIFLIPKYGPIGAGICMNGARFFSTFIMRHFSLKVEKMDHNSFFIYIFSLSAFVISLVPLLFSSVFLLHKIAIAVLSLSFGLYLLRKDGKFIISVIKNKTKKNEF